MRGKTFGAGLSAAAEGGWRMVRWAAAVAFGLGVVDAAGAAIVEPPQRRLLMSAGVGALLAVSALAVFGVWRRARWALWVGGLLSVAVVVAVPGATLARLQNAVAPISSASLALAWTEFAVYAAFLAGLTLLCAARR